MEPIAFLRKLKDRGIDLSELDTLEVYGGFGKGVRRYASYFKSLEAREIDPTKEDALRKNLPMATVKITDSYEEIKLTSSVYDLIISDNPMSTHGFPGQTGRCEHFDLFPDIFRIGKESLILALNVIPRKKKSRRYPYIFNPEQLRRRQEFYETETPELVLPDQMVQAYVKKASQCGYALEWWFTARRNSLVVWLVLRLRRESE